MSSLLAPESDVLRCHGEGKVPRCVMGSQQYGPRLSRLPATLTMGCEWACRRSRASPAEGWRISLRFSSAFLWLMGGVSLKQDTVICDLKSPGTCQEVRATSAGLVNAGRLDRNPGHGHLLRALLLQEGTASRIPSVHTGGPFSRKNCPSCLSTATKP